MAKGKHKQQRGHGRRGHYHGEDDDPIPSSAFDTSISLSEITDSPDEDSEDSPSTYSWEGQSKFDLYQLSVQSPKGDISYLQKFFLTYVGGRSPIHLQEDFCGTALICAEWLKGGIQRVATGLDLDLEALMWGLQNNFDKIGGGSCNRIRLFHGNVLRPICSAKSVSITKMENDSESKDGDNGKSWPAVDIICAFNYSCCCLHNRADLVSYFKNAHITLSVKGGIFAMDLYGGISSESPLKLRRHFPNFTYIWEQEAFDVLTRMTKISLHFQLKNNKILRHAFSYHWRMWSLPEVKDCLEEAGFDSVHFWLRDMPALEEDNEDDWENDAKYEEVTSFRQQSAWNAYIVAVAHRKSN